MSSSARETGPVAPPPLDLWAERAQRWGLRGMAVTAVTSEAGLQLAAVLTALGWLGRRPRLPDGARDLVIALGAWLSLGLAAALASRTAPEASQLNKVFMAVALCAGWALVARVDRRESRVLLWLLGGATLVAALAGLAQYFFGGFPGEQLLHDPTRGWQGQLYVPESSRRALTGTLRNRLKMGMALLFASSCAAGLLVAVRRRRWAACALALVVALLPLTHMKSAIGALAFALAALTGLVRVPRLRRVLAPLLLAGHLVAMGGVLWLTTSRPLEDLPSGGLSTRLFIWQHSLRLGAEHPLFGSGIGTFRRLARPLYGADVSTSHAQNAHNQHLTPFAEGGLVGLAAWTLVAVAVAAALTRAWRHELEPIAAGLRAAATVFVLAAAMIAYVHDPLFHPTTAVLFWCAAGVLTALAVPPGAERWR